MNYGAKECQKYWHANNEFVDLHERSSKDFGVQTDRYASECAKFPISNECTFSNMRSHTKLLTFGLAIFSILSCQKIAYTSEAEKATVQTELEAFVVNLSTIWPLDSAQISSNLLDYMAMEGNKF